MQYSVIPCFTFNCKRNGFKNEIIENDCATTGESRVIHPSCAHCATCGPDRLRLLSLWMCIVRCADNLDSVVCTVPAHNLITEARLDLLLLLLPFFSLSVSLVAICIWMASWPVNCLFFIRNFERITHRIRRRTITVRYFDRFSFFIFNCFVYVTVDLSSRACQECVACWLLASLRNTRNLISIWLTIFDRIALTLTHIEQRIVFESIKRRMFGSCHAIMQCTHMLHMQRCWPLSAILCEMRETMNMERPTAEENNK